MKMKTKDLATAALLTALSLLIPFVFPRFEMGPFSATFASHVPVFVAMFVSPVVAVAAGIGSAVAFFLRAPVYIGARATMHIFVGLAGAVMIQKKMNPALVGAVTLVIHAVLETVAVIPFIGMLPVNEGFSWYAVVLIGTSIHHVIDYIIAFAVASGLKRAKVI